MTDSIPCIIRRHCRPLEPISSGQTEFLRSLDGIRAVLFDVYGTLLVSAIGEVGSADTGEQSRSFANAMQSVGINECDAARGATELAATIRRHRETAIAAGVEAPEVDIVTVWSETLSRLFDGGELSKWLEGIEIELLAIDYECRVNPVWPMTHADRCLLSLCDSGVTIGLISNAQFFTKPILEELMGTCAADLGLDAGLEFLSYRCGRAKPGLSLYEQAEQALRQRGIAAAETIFVGNDMLNDVMPASRVGFRTALFAGDQRSLRLRTGDERIAGIHPDLILTDLMQLPSCLGFDTL